MAVSKPMKAIPLELIISEAGKCRGLQYLCLAAQPDFQTHPLKVMGCSISPRRKHIFNQASDDLPEKENGVLTWSKFLAWQYCWTEVGPCNSSLRSETPAKNSHVKGDH